MEDAFPSVLDAFLDSDVQTLASRDTYLGYAKNVQCGNYPELELAGNAFHVRFVCGHVCLDNLWDETAGSAQLSIGEFIRVLSAWVPK